MGVVYWLVNWTKKEYVAFSSVGGFKDTEIVGEPVAAAMATWYLIKHRHDRIAFVGDELFEWPFPEGSIEDVFSYRDVSSEIIDELIAKNILIDEGRQLLAEADAELDVPELYIRDIRVNGWTRGGWIPAEAKHALRQISGDGND